LKQRTVWIANYDVNTPQLYGQWSKWDFWQMTDRMQGSNYGMDSKQLDGNYWRGTLEELHKFCGSAIVIPKPEPVLTLEQRVDKLEGWAKIMGYK
jgi:GH25 family lysozyme M1 (1,4-beta-N-acetylmuramidase)